MSRVGRIQKLVEGRWRIWRSLILMEMRRIDQPESLQRADIKIVIFRARGAGRLNSQHQVITLYHHQ
jgi:hypothetical protein